MPHGASRTSPLASDQGSTTPRPDSPGRQRAPYSNERVPWTGTSSSSSSDAKTPGSQFPLGSKCFPQRSQPCRSPRGSVRSKPPLPYQPSCLFSQIAAADPFPNHPDGLMAAAYAAGLTRVYHGFTGNGKSSFGFLQKLIETTRLKPPPPPPAASSPGPAASAPSALPWASAAQPSSRTRTPLPPTAPP